ncbi:MAG TPA: DNA repair protein RecO [Verrucomicrobiae bacterium]|nr:DNA repair protein RecO [Verrucomicrobiae bacterium]
MANDERALGLILRVRPLTETSLIVHWLTPDAGRLATVAKAARRANSPFRGKLDLLYIAEFSLARSRRSELHTLREVSLRETHEFLRHDLSRLRQAAHAVALLEQTTETETPVPTLFQLAVGWLAELAHAAPGPLMVFAFEFKLLLDLGLMPDLDSSALSSGAREVARRLAGDEWPALRQLRITEGQTRELKNFLHGFLIHHLGRIPKGRATALDQSEE